MGGCHDRSHPCGRASTRIQARQGARRSGDHGLGRIGRIRLRHQLRLGAEPLGLPRREGAGAAGDVRVRHRDAAESLSLCGFLAGHAACRLEARLAGPQPRPAGGLSDPVHLLGDRPSRIGFSRLRFRHLPGPGDAADQSSFGAFPAVAYRPSAERSRGDLADLLDQRSRHSPLRKICHDPDVRDHRGGAVDYRLRLPDPAGDLRRSGQ